MLRIRPHVCLAAALLLLAACGQDAQKRRGEVSAQPVQPAHRVVSLNPCADAVLADIAPRALIAVSHYSHDPRGSSMPLSLARKWRTTGGTAEEVIALDPDLVIASSFISPSLRSALGDAGIRVETVGSVNSLEEARAQVRDLAALTGSDEAGARLIARMDDAAARAQARTADLPARSALIWQAGGIVPGVDTLIADLAARAGLASHSAARGLGQGAYLPLERVLADPPDIVISTAGDRALTHPVLGRVAGMRRAALDPRLTFCGGPGLPDALDALVDIRLGAGDEAT